MAVLDRLSFLQQLPTLMKATSDDEAPCPGYVLEEIAQMSHESAGGRQCLLEYLLHRLQSQSCHMKLKVLKILLYLCAHGSSHFLQALRRNATFIQEVTVFSGPPDPLHGNSLYQKVRAMAQDLASTLFADALWPQPSALPPRPLPPTGMGSRCHDGSALQGFGYTQECADPGESLLSTIQKVAGVMSSAVLPGPDLSGHSKPEEEVYQPVMAPPPGVSRSVREALPTVTTHTRASRQPGLAGGGWEESDSGHSSQRSSQENCDSGQTSGSGSDGHSGASREVGDLTERVEFAHLSDCTQEMSLVDTVTRGTKVFLTREEVQHFVKECALLNCEAVLELLNRTLQDPSTSVQMRSMSAISSLMCSDLLSHDHMFSVTRPHLQRLSEGSPGPVANRATKILRQFEALSRSKPPSQALHQDDTCPFPRESPVRLGGDLLVDATPFSMAESVLKPIDISPFSSGPSEQSRATVLTPPPALNPSLSEACDAKGQTAHKQSGAADPSPLTPAEAEEPAARAVSHSPDAWTLNGDLESETAGVHRAGAPPRGSLFAGMDIVPSPADTRVLCSATEASLPSTKTAQRDLERSSTSTKVHEHTESSAFSFLNL